MLTQLIGQWGGTTGFTEALGARHLHAKIAPAEAERILSWDDLSSVIVTHRLAPPDLFLAKGGQELSSSSYLNEGPSPLRRQHPVVDPDKLRARLAEGATLVINNLHEMLPSVTTAAQEIAQAVGERVQANVYATWGNTSGFTPHWDDHDVLIVQVHGSKRWDVYGPGKPWPLDHADDADNQRPCTPIWSGALKPGDVLYLPRGWWHNVEGTGEPTVHLTYGFQRRTGMHYLNWLLFKARNDETFRVDLPRDRQDRCQKALIERLAMLVEEYPVDMYLSDFSSQLQNEAPSVLMLRDVAALPPTSEK